MPHAPCPTLHTPYPTFPRRSSTRPKPSTVQPESPRRSYPTSSAFNSYNCTPGARIDEGKHTHASVYGSNKRGEIVDIEWCQRMCDISSKCAGISISTGAEPRCRVVKAGIADPVSLPLSNSEWWTACLPLLGPANGTGPQGRARGVSLANSPDNVSIGGPIVAAG